MPVFWIKRKFIQTRANNRRTGFFYLLTGFIDYQTTVKGYRKQHNHIFINHLTKLYHFEPEVYIEQTMASVYFNSYN